MNKQSIQELIQSQENDHNLDQAFFCNQELFDLSYQSVFMKQWVFVTHASIFSSNSNTFNFHIQNNVIKIEKISKNKFSANLSSNNKNCHIKVYESLIFINLSSDPYDFEEFISPLKPFIKIHGLEDAKIAYEKEFIFNASHLATIHNFKECAHCTSQGTYGHKDYVGLHGSEYCNSYGAGVGSGIDSKEFADRLYEWTKETKARGNFVDDYTETTDKFFRIAERTPLKENIFSETVDGSRACSHLMGQFKDNYDDNGYTAIGFSPFNSFVANTEFVILFVFVPVSTNKTIVKLMWCTHKDAEVDIEKMIFLWTITTQEDAILCEINQKGIESKSFVPGKYGKLETALVQYQKFYLSHLQNHLNTIV